MINKGKSKKPHGLLAGRAALLIGRNLSNVLRRVGFALPPTSRNLIQPSVANIKNEIDTDHQKVENIEAKDIPFLTELHPIGIIEQLGCDSRKVAEYDQQQKAQTFAFCSSGPIRF